MNETAVKKVKISNAVGFLCSSEYTMDFRKSFLDKNILEYVSLYYSRNTKGKHKNYIYSNHSIA